MPLHTRDRANAYSVGMLEQTIKLAIYDLEVKPPRTNKALVELKTALATHAERARYHADGMREHDTFEGQPIGKRATINGMAVVLTAEGWRRC